MYHPHLLNGSLVDGPPSPSPTRSRKRKRSDEEEDYNTPTKTRTRSASSQILGLPTPDEKGNRMLIPQNTEFMGTLLTGTANSVLVQPLSAVVGSFDLERKEPIQPQQMTPPASVSPSVLPNLPGLHQASPSRTRASTAVNRMNIPFPNLLLSIPSLLIQPPNMPLHVASLEASVLALRRILTLHTSNPTSQVLTQEQECYTWTMFAELGMQIITSLTPSPDPDLSATKGVAQSGRASPTKAHYLTSLLVPSWGPTPGEMETAISRALRLADQLASLRPLRHNLTILHAQLVCLQDNHKHAKVLLKRLLPLSTNTQPIAREKVWASYEAHLAITNQILSTPLSNSLGATDVPAALSQLNALFMLANQYGDHALVQLICVIRLTTLFQNYESSDVISGGDVDEALGEAESILGLDGFDKQAALPAEKTATSSLVDAAKAANSTPGATSGNEQPITPFTSDALAGAGKGVNANLKTPAFSFPTNPLGMNVYGAGERQAVDVSTTQGDLVEDKDLIPPYLRYMRVQTLMVGILWLTHSGESTRSSERLTLLHEMMDKLNELSKTEGWAADNETGLILIPLYSNPGRTLRIQATHPRVFYQLTFVISAIAKRDCLGRKPKRKVFAQEGLRISGGDDPRTSNGPKPDILEGGSALDFAPGLGLRDLRRAQQSIAHVRATAYYELVSACLIRSEFEEADQHLADLVSFLRAPETTQTSQPSMWDQYASRISLLYGHLAHALGQSQRALDCYRMVCFLEEEESLLWTMGRVGEIVLRIGATVIRGEERASGTEFEAPEDPNQDNRLWRTGEREYLVEMAAGLVDRCLNGGLGEHMAAVGRIIAASLSSEIVRAKQNLKSGLDLSCKSRDNYLRLLVLLFTAGQYLYTHTDYALTILETCRQLASSLGAVTAPMSKEVPLEDNRRSSRSSNVEGRPQYHVGHARAGLWIGQRFSELYKRRGASDKAAKQNAINTVFQKAIDEIDLQALKNGGPATPLNFEDFPPIRPTSKLVTPATSSKAERPKSSKLLMPSTSRTRARNEGPSAKNDHFHDTAEAEASEQSQETSASYPPSSKASDNGRSKRSGTSYSRSSVSVHSQQMSVTSIGSRRSTRARGDRKVIIESDDEETGRKGMSEDEFEDSDTDAQV